MAARFKKLESKLQAGEYLFQPAVSMKQVLDDLVSGRSVLHAITFPEGLTSQMIVDRLKADTILSGDIAAVPPDGSLMPDTYKFTRGATRQQMLDQMQRVETRVVQEIWNRRAPGLPINTPAEFVTLASIVEKETGRADERSRVAAVFINRLRKGMRLQSDPTVIYGLFGGAGRPPDWSFTNRGAGEADALQHLSDRRPATLADRQSGTCGAGGGGQPVAHERALLRRRRDRRACLRRDARRAQPQRRTLAADTGGAGEGSSCGREIGRAAHGSGAGSRGSAACGCAAC